MKRLKKRFNKYNSSILKYKDIKETIEKRYNILIIIIIIIMSILSIFLFNIQIIKNNYYLTKVNNLRNSVIKSTSTPRGRIYDRNGKILVDNEVVKVIFYNKPNNVTTQDEIDISYKVANMIDLDYSNISLNNLKKFWIKNNNELANKKISQEEWNLLDERKLTLDDIYNLKLERITDDELDLLSEIDKKAAYIYYLMNVGYSFDEKIIKKVNVTEEEYAIIAENAYSIPGFDVRLDWKRIYPYGDTFRTILGSVSTTETGLPYELKDYYYESAHYKNSQGRFLLASIAGRYTNLDIRKTLKETKDFIILASRNRAQSTFITNEYIKINPKVEVSYLSGTKLLPQLETPDKTFNRIMRYL